SLAGLPRFLRALPAGRKAIAGVEVTLERGGRALLFPTERAGLTALCQAIALGIDPSSEDLLAIGLDPDRLGDLRARFPERCHAGAESPAGDRSAGRHAQRMAQAAEAL